MNRADSPLPSNSPDRAGHLFRANDALDNERQWLAHLNRYLALFDLEPLTLAPARKWRGLRREKVSRFLRLRARTPRRVETGPLVTVIMPAFNAEATLDFAARSVLNQTWRPLELILIDDASTDATPRIAERLARKDSRVRLLRNAVNVGPYVARNRAIQIAHGEFITGQDADEWAHPERIERQTAFMLADPNIKASHDMMLRMKKNGRIPPYGQKDPAADSRILQRAWAGVFYERQFLNERLGYFDSLRFGADGELLARARRLLGENFRVNRALGILSLDDPASLSRHPVHGVSRKTGLSPVRLEYRNAYRAWHETLSPEDARLPFPHYPRRFPAPGAMLVPQEDIRQVMEDSHRT